jgi:DNA-binding GntR family transcriptional regulator
VEQARDLIRRGIALHAGLSRRKQQHLRVVDAYVGNDVRRAYVLMREHLKEFLCDALILSHEAPEGRGRSRNLLPNREKSWDSTAKPGARRSKI